MLALLYYELLYTYSLSDYLQPMNYSCFMTKVELSTEIKMKIQVDLGMLWGPISDPPDSVQCYFATVGGFCLTMLPNLLWKHH